MEVSIDMKKLSSWSFPTDTDTREKSNQSSWQDGRDVTLVLKDGSKVVDDPSSIKTHPMMTAPGFSLRLTVAPTKGGAILLWLGVAPIGLDLLKQACKERGLTLTSPYIPTYGVKLPSHQGPQTKYEAVGTYLPQEKSKGPTIYHSNPRVDNLELNWGLYPLIQKLDDGSYPLSDGIYREFSAAMRSVAGHCNRKDAKSLFEIGVPWKEETVWNFKANKLWPEPTMDVPENTTLGMSTTPLIRVSGLKYSTRGGDTASSAYPLSSQTS